MKIGTAFSLGMLLALTVTVPALADKPERIDAAPGTVSLPLGEYDRLVERAAHPPKPPSPPPVPAVLSRADIRLRATGSDVRGSVALEGEVLLTGPRLIPLLAGATVLDARMGAKPLPLASDASGLAALVNGPGPFSIQLDWGTSLAQEPGMAAFVFTAPLAGSVKVSLDVPGSSVDVRIEPGVVTQRSAAAGRTLVEATLDPGARTRFSWSARETSAPAARESRYLAEVKTLLTVGEAELRMAALVDVNVVQGEPARFALRLPGGFEVTSVSGSNLDKTEEAPGVLTLVVREPGRRRHQFLITLEQAHAGGSFNVEPELPSIDGAQRETGEVAVEGLGTLELLATEAGGLRRMDVRETAEPLRGLAREALLAAFRYQRRADAPPKLTLDVKRYPNAAVLAALAERAVVTTLTTTEGRTLTEVSLTVRNHAQPFLKVALPEGSTLLTAEVAGEGVKPVKGDDGTRVPLLRAGFRPDGPYNVSFVYVQPGAPFAKKGDAHLAVPRMDVPINVLEWELFLPDRYLVKDFIGDAIPAALMPAAIPSSGVVGALSHAPGIVGGVAGGMPSGRNFTSELELVSKPDTGPSGSGSVSGSVLDNQGAVVPGATVTLSGNGVFRQAVSGSDGSFTIVGVPPGRFQLGFDLSGFKSVRRSVIVAAGHGARQDAKLEVGSMTEEIDVVGGVPVIDTTSLKSEPQQVANAPSANVFNLQRRVAGVLPVRIDVPRAGVSYRFVRPLVLDEETTVSFAYKTR